VNKRIAKISTSGTDIISMLVIWLFHTVRLAISATAGLLVNQSIFRFHRVTASLLEDFLGQTTFVWPNKQRQSAVIRLTA